MVLNVLVAALAIGAPQQTTKNVVFVMTDGLRWQEVFSGADKVQIEKVKDPAIKARFWRDSENERRKALMPFTWSMVAQKGQLYGNRNLGSFCQVTNGLKFSYPGYSETLCGYPDPRINSNDPTPNPNQTVFEWLNSKPEYKGRTAAFGAWDVISAAFNPKRCGFVVNAGYEPLVQGKSNSEIKLLNRIKAEQPHTWGDEPFDVLTFHTALQYVRLNRPRLIYISLGETDDWAHDNNYAEYLTSTRRYDDYVKEIWETLQSMPQYRGTTTLVMTCDHGRGDGEQWTTHGAAITHAEYTWLGFLGPDTPSLGEMKAGDSVTNSQVASTIAAFLGYDYKAAQPKAGAAISRALRLLPN